MVLARPWTEAAPAKAPAGGHATMSLRFARSPDGETFIDHQLARYPYHVCRALRFQGDPAGMATVYLQSASGGLYEDDRLQVHVEADDSACAHVTTQASTVVHAARHGEAAQQVTLRVGTDALLEYLADPVILFPHARLHSAVRLTVNPGGAAIMGESYLAHDPESRGRPFSLLASDVCVADPEGRVLVRDRFMLPGSVGQGMPMVAGTRFAAHGSMLCYGYADRLPGVLEHLRESLDELEHRHGDLYAGSSTLPGDQGVWIRMLARDGAALRRAMHAAWTAIRMATVGVPPRPRRK